MSTGSQKDKKADRLTDRQTDRLSESQKELVVSLVIKTKVVQNVNRMSKSWADGQEDNKLLFSCLGSKVTVYS